MNAAPRCATAALISGTSCALSPEKLRATNDAPSASASSTRSIGSSLFDGALLGLAALVGGGGELALGQAVDAVVLDDVHHVDAPAHHVRELAEPDRRRIAVAGNAEVDQVLVGQRGAGQHRGHPAMHAVEPVRVTEEVRRRLRRAADARELRDAVRCDVELEERLDDRGGNRVVSATRAQRRHGAFVVAPRVAARVFRQRRVMDLRLGEVGHRIGVRVGNSHWDRSRDSSRSRMSEMQKPGAKVTVRLNSGGTFRRSSDS